MVLVAHALESQVPVVDLCELPPRFFELFAVRDVAHSQARVARVVVVIFFGQRLLAAGVFLVGGCGAAVGPCGFASGFASCFGFGGWWWGGRFSRREGLFGF